jgi:hypothetical protein
LLLVVDGRSQLVLSLGHSSLPQPIAQKHVKRLGQLSRDVVVVIDQQLLDECLVELPPNLGPRFRVGRPAIDGPLSLVGAWAAGVAVWVLAVLTPEQPARPIAACFGGCLVGGWSEGKALAKDQMGDTAGMTGLGGDYFDIQPIVDHVGGTAKGHGELHQQGPVSH